LLRGSLFLVPSYHVAIDVYLQLELLSGHAVGRGFGGWRSGSWATIT